MEEVLFSQDRHTYGNDNTFMHYIAHCGSSETVQRVLDVLPDSLAMNLLLARNSSGELPLHVSVQDKDEQMMIVFLHHTLTRFPKIGMV